MPAPTLTPPTRHTPPQRSEVQRFKALKSANEIRLARSELKRKLHARQAHIDDVLADPPRYLATMKVMDLVLAVPKWGRVNTLKALNACHISPAKTVGGLTGRQRTELVGALRARA